MVLAKEHLNIPRVVNPEDFASEALDELSSMTYLSYFVRHESPGYYHTLNWVCKQLRTTNITNLTVSKANFWSKLFSFSTQLSMKFQLLIKLKYQQIKKFLALSLSEVVFIMLINVKLQSIGGILTFMSRINFVLSWVDHEKCFITSGPVINPNNKSVYGTQSNCTDPDQTPHDAVSDQDLHCLLKECFIKIWEKKSTQNP